MIAGRIRAAAALVASSVAVIALTACGSGGHVTTGDSSSQAVQPTSGAPTATGSTGGTGRSSEATSSGGASPEPTDKALTGQSDGADASLGYVTTVEATEADLQPAKQFIVDWYGLLMAGKYDEACREIYFTPVESVTREALIAHCVGTLTNSADNDPVDTAEVEELLGGIEPRLSTQGSIELIHPSGTTVVVVKGSDGNYYYDINSSAEKK